MDEVKEKGLARGKGSDVGFGKKGGSILRKSLTGEDGDRVRRKAGNERVGEGRLIRTDRPAGRGKFDSCRERP